MKIKIALAAALALFATAATAQTADELNQRVLDNLRARPTATTAAAAPVAPSAKEMGVYLGVNAGSNFRDGTDYQVGGLAGYQFHPNLAAEVTYDYNRLANGDDGQMVMGNLVASRQIGSTPITPYVLAGAGVGWNSLGTAKEGGNLSLYNVGGGVRVNMFRNVDIDARYRYVGSFDSSESFNQHVVTGGLNIRF